MLSGTEEMGAPSHPAGGRRRSSRRWETAASVPEAAPGRNGIYQEG